MTPTAIRKPSRRAKIVATLGPASSDATTIGRMVELGVDVFRFNFSHGTAEDHRARFTLVRAAAAAQHRSVAILQDLQGPKFRVGRIAGGGVELAVGTRFVFDRRDTEGDGARAPLPHPELFEALLPGHRLLVDDGRLSFRVIGGDRQSIETEVETAGVLKDRKGVNLPGATIPLSAVTEKDREDIVVGRALGVDWVALSFVQKPDDVLEARALIDPDASLCAKIEKPGALKRLVDIVALSDGIMVARGDLGVEVPPEDVPGHQRTIVAACRRAGKPVIVATQMLESMTTAPAPTRAEASDVATAVFEGADAVMLSAESASGRYPTESVAMMARIVEATEHHPTFAQAPALVAPGLEPSIAHAVAAAATQLAEAIDAAGIVAFTTTGTTAARVSRERPATPILAAVAHERVARRLALLWGVQPLLFPDPGPGQPTSLDDLAPRIAAALAQTEVAADPARPLVLVAGAPFGTPGQTNAIRVLHIGR